MQLIHYVINNFFEKYQKKDTEIQRQTECVEKLILDACQRDAHLIKKLLQKKNEQCIEIKTALDKAEESSPHSLGRHKLMHKLALTKFRADMLRKILRRVNVDSTGSANNPYVLHLTNN